MGYLKIMLILAAALIAFPSPDYTCSRCGGSGWAGNKICPICNGSGQHR